MPRLCVTTTRRASASTSTSRRARSRNARASGGGSEEVEVGTGGEQRAVATLLVGTRGVADLPSPKCGRGKSMLAVHRHRSQAAAVSEGGGGRGRGTEGGRRGCSRWAGRWVGGWVGASGSSMRLRRPSNPPRPLATAVEAAWRTRWRGLRACRLRRRLSFGLFWPARRPPLTLAGLLCPPSRPCSSMRRV